MKRLLLLLLSLHLLAVSCLPGGNAQELAEAPALWQHHNQDHAASDLADFFYDHFLAAAHTHHDTGGANKHQSLPFHHVHDYAAPAVFLPPVAARWALLVAPAWSALSASRPAPAVLATHPGMARRCWQPPQA
ncbi:hypothetical protein [Hymenobacter psychrophilus]|uniref:Uncharacterized protein n=1 Tax=Hymenobacter psychrophilus TaxID=651662 RepID=A0A1H3FCR1_9BACT|nr:hypothetical protein [Hymenobacter psychrophilus]SDX88766.1 hypothetical protein SAMN04488069_10414 [Hymenobacter psychrophilus]